MYFWIVKRVLERRRENKFYVYVQHSLSASLVVFEVNFIKRRNLSHKLTMEILITDKTSENYQAVRVCVCIT